MKQIRNKVILERKKPLKSNTYKNLSYHNKVLKIKNYEVSIQCNELAHCKPRENIRDPNSYLEYEVAVFRDGKAYIPMAFKEYFDKNGIGAYIEKSIVNEIIQYISSPICIMMEAECR